MNILLTGGSGFIGRHLCRRLAAHGHHLIILTRKPRRVARGLPEEARLVSSLDDIADDEIIDGIVNLAGESLFAGRWSRRRKEVLLASRVGVTQDIVSLVSRLERKPAVLVSGSAVGFYGDAGNAELTEDSSARKKDFGYRLCDAWEQAARPVSRQGLRLCLIRTGIVLGRDGGMLKQLLPLYKLGLGAKMGDGNQWLSWVHIDDMVAILVRALETPGIEGIFNACAPAPVTQREFHQLLASKLHRPALLRVPATALKVGLGELSGMLLGGQRVYPRRLEQQGFMFRYPDLASAVDHLISRKKA
ncbi:MAG: TIGR01777 family protein [Alcanivoracaceae bacterium]|uniref:TIGR01777 family oxidoreductase n=1 Tax=uncultured Alcanivorax sp. TaxID=191215 RepID=UPI000C61B540|nr:TIGR01777 family oxidoreductase [uncultured Alcanivorax sp.]MAX56624.1 TIGR01777 family protein [Alcanivoracaceae bacterium]MCG8439024.1 TIGR01777 family oxidoreductase [Pseudomonadales bacterium]MED5431196.1 TIGR01777 family oxidoreductase [Pseudomonadota bacterium]